MSKFVENRLKEYLSRSFPKFESDISTARGNTLSIAYILRASCRSTVDAPVFWLLREMLWEVLRLSTWEKLHTTKHILHFRKKLLRSINKTII